MRILIRGLGEHIQSLEENNLKTFNDLFNFLTKGTSISTELAFTTNGRNMRLNDTIPLMGIIDVKKIVRGGKGGFGSLLKGQPPVKKRTQNFDACRDLSGRRMRHVNQEKIMKDWQQKKSEEEKFLRMYDKPGEEDNVKDYVDSDKKKEVLKLNQKYLIESVQTTQSVSDSIKFLLKKQKREEGKNNENKIEVLKKNIQNNINIAKRINILNTVNTDLKDMEEKLLEQELFSLD